MNVVPVQWNERLQLFGMLQVYLDELAHYYEDMRRDERGDYPYPYFNAYFEEKDRWAFFICDEGKTAGFAMINRHSATQEPVDYAMAEFYILPAFRRKHLADAASRQLLQRFPGKWQIKFSLKNLAAVKLWREIAKDAAPKVLRWDDEEILTFLNS